MIKNLILICAVMAGGASALAAKTNCPAGTKKSMHCISTWQPGDEDIAAVFLDSITLCSRGERVLMVIQKGAKVEMGEADVARRAGGNSYTLKIPAVDLTLSHATGLATGRSRQARLSILVATGSEFSSSYTCRF